MMRPDDLTESRNTARGLAGAILVVSGLPRSGTSLMMAMLQAGGLPLHSDGLRGPDADNPNGYFEFEPVKRLRTDHAWLADAQGKAVKIVVPLLFQMPETFDCRVLFMERNLDEVIASQTAMLSRKGLQPKLPPASLKAAFQRQLDQAREFLAASPRRQALTLHFRDVLSRPAAVAAEVAVFLKANLDVTAMAAVVHPALYRQRTNEPPRDA